MTPFSFGTTTFIINLLFVAVQILILKKEFKKKDMLQIFVALCFGLFIDLGMYVSEPLKTHNYWGADYHASGRMYDIGVGCGA